MFENASTERRCGGRLCEAPPVGRARALLEDAAEHGDVNLSGRGGRLVELKPSLLTLRFAVPSPACSDRRFGDHRVGELAYGGCRCEAKTSMLGCTYLKIIVQTMQV
jgi:hypothetical protein